MTETATICQCPACFRFFDPASSEWLPQRMCVPQMLACGAADCASVAAERQAQEQARLQARMDRRKAAAAAAQPKKSARPSCVPKAASFAAHSAPPEVDLPEEAQQRPGPGAAAKDFSQRDFQASGAAAGANAVLTEFFSKPENFGLWFPAKMLVEVVMKGKSLHMNNRAIDIRPHFLRQGLFIDNWMISPCEFQGKVSCYRVCRIEDALSLDAAAKERLLGRLPAEGNLPADCADERR